MSKVTNTPPLGIAQPVPSPRIADDLPSPSEPAGELIRQGTFMPHGFRQLKLFLDREVAIPLVVHGSQALMHGVLEQRFAGLVGDKRIVSFGEEHDLNMDTSFSEVLQLSGPIFKVQYNMLVHHPDGEEERIAMIRHEFKQAGKLQALDALLKKMQDQSIGELCQYHPGRLFATRLMPLLRNLGYTDIIMEGLNDVDPASTFRRSKDQIGTLLMMLQAHILGIRVHGVYSEGIWSLFYLSEYFLEKIDKIHECIPDARIITFSGALHNMTMPLEGKVPLGDREFDIKDSSFAKKLQEIWGREFQSIDLVDFNSTTASHLETFRRYGHAGNIVEVSHSNDQVAFVLSP